jgi:hypothetical protein
VGYPHNRRRGGKGEEGREEEMERYLSRVSDWGMGWQTLGMADLGDDRSKSTGSISDSGLCP